MLLGKKRKLGRHLEDITEGEKLAFTEKMEDKDLLLYLGLTDDANPLYIQHDYASLTPYKKPIIPSFMLTGMISSAISKYLPGPGSHILKQELSFIKPAFHYSMIEFQLVVEKVDLKEHHIIIKVKALNEQKETILQGNLTICPPYLPEAMDGHALENF